MTVGSGPAPAAGKSAGNGIGKGKKPLIAALAVVVAAAAVYGLVGIPRNAGDAACRPAVDLARRLVPLVHGEVAAITPADTALRLPEMKFRDGAGQERALADWHGRTVLFNLWATWCVPCRREMPALDALQAKLGGPDFEVVAVNIDTRDPEKPKAWLRDTGIVNLAYYADANARVFQDLKTVGKALGMPTTLMVDREGCEVATLAGPAEWSSEDGIKLVSAALAR
jgi:thiol-disulfide isomerase/thioredoxin